MRKKTVPIIALMILLLQTLAAPLVAIAEEINTQEPSLELTALKGQLADANEQLLSPEQPVKEDATYWLQVEGNLRKVNQLSDALVMTVSDNFRVTSTSAVITDDAANPIGQATIDGQLVHLDFPAELTGELSFKLKLAVTYQNPAELTADQLVLTSALGATELPFAVEPELALETPAVDEEVEEEVVEEAATQDTIKVPTAPQSIKQLTTKEIAKDIITAVTWLVHPDPEQDPTIDSTFKIGYDWALPEDVREKMVGGETFTFTLPKELVINTPQSGQLKNEGGPDFGSYTISTAGEVVITFNEHVADMNEITGTLWAVSQLNKQLITTPEEVVIKTPIKGTDHEITIPLTSLADKSLDKKGELDKRDNPTAVTWNIYVNKTKKTLTDIVLEDTLPEGLILEDSSQVKVYEVAVDHFGNVGKDLAELAPSDFSVNGTTVTIPGTSNKSYRVEYVTKIEESVKPDDGGNPSFTNRVTQTSKEGEAVKAEATVTAHYDKMLTKKMANYDQDKQVFDWQVAYNFGEKTIEKKDAFLTDSFSDNLELMTDTVKLINQTTGETLVKGTDYEVKVSGQSFMIQFKQDIDYKVAVTYSTKVKEGYIVDDGGQAVSNSVVSFGDNQAGDQGEARQNGLIKWNSEVDHTAQTASWLIEVNRSQYHMTDWQMTDTFTSKGLTLDEASIEVRTDSREGTKLELGKDYAITVTDPKVGYTIELLGEYKSTTKTLFISYTTAYDKNELEASDNIFRNQAVATWLDEKGEKKTNTAHSGFKASPETYNNGSKSGSYNAVTKKITWTVNVNYRRNEILNGSIVDQIKGNQKYVKGSAKLATYNVLKNGEMELVAPVTDAVITEPTVDNKQTLTAFLPEKSERLVYRLTFETSLVDEIIGASEEYDNVASFKVDGKEQDVLKARVDIKHGGTFATKNGHYDQNKPDEVAWSIRVNESQSTINGFELVDEPSDNQRIKEETIKITELSPSGNGDLSPSGRLLVLDQDYQIEIVPDLNTGQETMTIKFLHEISKAYEISYVSQLLLKDGNNSVTNKVSVKGDNEKVTVENVSKNIDVYHVDSGGSSTGKVMDFYLRKENDHGKKLAGITFKLLDGKTRKTMRLMTTGEDGLIHFENVLSGTYYLQEEKSLSGYFKSDSLVNGLEKIEVKKGDYPKESPLVVVNVLNEVELFKVDASGDGIGGATFGLAKKDQTGNFQPVLGFQEIQSEQESGRVFIEGLVKGEYRLTEIAAASGYIKNTTPIDFTISGNEEKRLELGEFTNYQGTAHILKVDANGNGLAGARFNLYNDKMTIVQENVTSDKTGLVAFTNLAPGKYSVVEVAAPTGYLLNKTVQRFEISNELVGQPKSVELEQLTNFQSTVELAKVTEAKEPLAGATFAVFTQAGEAIKTGLVSDDAGKIKVTGLAGGDYYFQETSAAPGYILNTEKYNFKIATEAQQAPELVKTRQAINYQGSAILIKKDAAGKALAKAEFKVVDEAGQTVKETIVSTKKGEVLVSGLAPGTYYFVETKAPKGHVVNSEKIGFTILAENEGQPSVVKVADFINYQGSAELNKTDAEGKGLAGAEFKVINSKNKVVAKSLVSSDQGIVSVTGLKAGDYRFVETKAPEGYVLNTTPKSFTIQANYEGKPAVEHAGELINYQGSARLIKKDATGKILPGAEFKVIDEAGQTVKETIVSNEDGEVLVAGLAPGTYYFEETKAPKGYLLNSQKVKFTILAESEGTPAVIEVGEFRNYQGSVTMRKVNEKGEVLAGAKFKLSSPEQESFEIREVVSDEGGLIEIKDLAPGNYVLSEVEAPEIYMLNLQEIKFTIEDSAEDKPQVIDLGEFVNYRGSIHFKKVDGHRVAKATQGLAKAEFTLSKTAGYQSDQFEPTIHKADENGEVTIKDLAPGRYVLEETQAPTGFIQRLEPIVFEIATSAFGQPDNAYSFNDQLIFENYQGTAELTKLTENGEPLAGSSFNVINTETEKVVQTDLISNEMGIVKAENLAPGNYAFVETAAPNGYLINQKEVAFTIAESSEDGKVDITGLELINYRGSITLNKVDVNNKPLADAEFSLFKKSLAGDQLIAEGLVTDDLGQITVIDLLATGEYYFKETQAPTGYILNSQLIDVTISQSANGKPEPVIVKAINYQGAASLVKVNDAQEPLADAVFNVVSKEQKDEQGNDLVIQSDLKSTLDGRVDVANLAPGEYAFVEVKAAPGYLLNTVEVPFTINATQAGEPEAIIAGNFINYQGSVRLTKVDQETKEVLAGAHFNLVDQTGKTLQEELMTDGEGQLVVDGLEPGTYQLIETQAPTGYQLDSTAVEFVIEDAASGKPTRVQVEKTNKAVVPVKPEKPTKQVGHKTKKPAKQNLPQAGAEDSSLLVFAGLGLITFVLGIKRRKTA